MLKVRVIPCLDVKDGRTVKGVGFRNVRDAGDPVALACRYDAEGADEICVLDITASIEKRGAVLDMVSRIACNCLVPLAVGGGVRSSEDARTLLRAGADKVAINSAALADPRHISEIAAMAGSQCTIVALDAKREDGRWWQLYSHGGSRPTGLDAVEFAARAVAHGAGEILLTSIDRDGGGSGYDIALIRAVCAVTTVPVIASGGAGKAEDLVAPVIEAGASAVLAASMFHEGRVNLAEAKNAIAAAGAPVRRVG